jgi:hypothetical protein
MFSARILLSPPAMQYLAEVLNQDQQIWLSDQIMRRPMGFAEFLLSRDGYEAIRLVVDLYKSHMDHDPTVHEEREG